MANVAKTFPAEVDQDYRLFPHQKHGLSLSLWATHVKTPTQKVAPDKGVYDVTLDDTYRYWMVFPGTTQPADWSLWHYVVDVEDGKIMAADISDGALTKINQNK